jgi:hypothetical protein
MAEQIVGNAELLLTEEETKLYDRQVAAMHSGSFSKEEAEYQNEPVGDEQCSTCTMFVPGFPHEKAGYCTQVKSFGGPEGFIFPDGWCKFYEADELSKSFESLSAEELDEVIAGLDESSAKG